MAGALEDRVEQPYDRQLKEATEIRGNFARQFCRTRFPMTLNDAAARGSSLATGSAHLDWLKLFVAATALSSTLASVASRSQRVQLAPCTEQAVQPSLM
jgi:hypothetical protein